MFANKIDPIQSRKQVTLSHHFLSDLDLERKGLYNVVVLLICLGVAFLSLEVYILYKKLFGEKEIELYAENLPNYFEMLQAKDCKEFLDDERKF